MVFIIQKPLRSGEGHTKSMASFSAMLVRNIIPVCCCRPVIASSEINSSVATQSLVVGNLGWACVGRPGIAGAGAEGAAADFLQPEQARNPAIPNASKSLPKRRIQETGSGRGRFQPNQHAGAPLEQKPRKDKE